MDKTYLIHKAGDDELYHYRKGGERSGVYRYYDAHGRLTSAGRDRAKNMYNWWNGPQKNDAKDTVKKVAGRRGKVVKTASGRRGKVASFVAKQYKIKQAKKEAKAEKERQFKREAEERARIRKEAEERAKVEADERNKRALEQQAKNETAEKLKKEAASKITRINKPVSEMTDAELQAAIVRLDKEREFKNKMVAAGRMKADSVLKKQANTMLKETLSTFATQAGKELGNYLVKQAKEEFTKSASFNSKAKAKEKDDKQKYDSMLEALMTNDRSVRDKWLSSASKSQIAEAVTLSGQIRQIRGLATKDKNK